MFNFNGVTMRLRPLLLALCGALWFCADSPSSAAFAFSWDNAKQGAFITALVRDESGRVFVGTEDNGVWIRGTRGGWSQYTTKNSGLSDDNIYSLAVDKQGRVWAGTGLLLGT